MLATGSVIIADSPATAGCDYSHSLEYGNSHRYYNEQTCYSQPGYSFKDHLIKNTVDAVFNEIVPPKQIIEVRHVGVSQQQYAQPQRNVPFYTEPPAQRDAQSNTVLIINNNVNTGQTDKQPASAGCSSFKIINDRLVPSC